MHQGIGVVCSYHLTGYFDGVPACVYIAPEEHGWEGLAFSPDLVSGAKGEFGVDVDTNNVGTCRNDVDD